MGMSKIYEGWKNSYLPSKVLKNVIDATSKGRLTICDSCEHHSKNHKGVRPDNHCTKCGCTLLPKSKCLSCSCPEKKWEAVITKNEQSKIDEK